MVEVTNPSACLKSDYSCHSCATSWLTSHCSSTVALLDLADESLGCSSLVILLERSSPNIAAHIHSLMYVGGTVVIKPPFQVDLAFVLVGLDV